MHVQKEILVVVVVIGGGGGSGAWRGSMIADNHHARAGTLAIDILNLAMGSGIVGWGLMFSGLIAVCVR